MLIVFSGLPGVGKTTLAKKLVQQLKATYVRIDTLEQALRSAGLVQGAIGPEGYLLGYLFAEENLCLGQTVIADSVNDCKETRDTWLSVAKRTSKKAVEVEIICSDKIEHRNRVETRVADISGHKQPTWEDVIARDYEHWDREHVVIDTAFQTREESMTELMRKLDLSLFTMPLFVGKETIDYSPKELASLRDEGR